MAESIPVCPSHKPRYASRMFEKAKYKVNKLIIQIKIHHNEETSDKIMTNGD